MKFRLIVRNLGLLLLVLCGCMAVATAAELVGFGSDGSDKEPVAEAFATGLTTSLLAGAGLLYLGRRTPAQRADRAAARKRGEKWVPPQLTRRDAMAMVAAGWVLGAAVAALPFFSWAWLHPEEAALVADRAPSPKRRPAPTSTGRRWSRVRPAATRPSGRRRRCRSSGPRARPPRRPRATAPARRPPPRRESRSPRHRPARLQARPFK